MCDHKLCMLVHVALNALINVLTFEPSLFESFDTKQFKRHEKYRAPKVMKSSKQHKRTKEILIKARLQMCYMFDWDRSITICNPFDCELATTTACSFFSSPSMKP